MEYVFDHLYSFWLHFIKNPPQAPIAPSPHTIRSVQKRPVGAELSKECKPIMKEPKKEKPNTSIPCSSWCPPVLIHTHHWHQHSSSGSEIFLRASYEPSLVYDCHGAYFHFVRNKLRQLDIWDKASQLIPPWKCYDELRPGTLILIKASLHIFVFMDNQENIKKKACFSFICIIQSATENIFRSINWTDRASTSSLTPTSLYLTGKSPCFPDPLHIPTLPPLVMWTPHQWFLIPLWFLLPKRKKKLSTYSIPTLII